MMNLVSFDVFDTLITRKTVTPSGIFLVLQEKLRYYEDFDGISDDFARLRFEAERKAEVLFSGREINIYDIYTVLCDFCHLNEDMKQKLVRLEVETEKECAIPLKDNILLLKEAVDSGDRVVLISDMYLNEDHIRDILVSVDGIFSNIRIYVSCDCNVTKKDGLLYEYVHETEKIDYEYWKHYGDNVVSDHNVAEIYGIRPVLIEKYEQSFLEKSIGRHFLQNECYDVQIFLGLIRDICRDIDNDFFRIGAICGGAILFPYVRWLINEALVQGIDSLLFMSRDGFILKKMADLIIENDNLEICTKYIYTSKNVLRDDGVIGKRALGYIKQVVADCGNYAFVDFHGTGKSMVKLSEKMGVIVKAFYYVIKGRPTCGKTEFFSYTCHQLKSGLIEVFCRAPHGPVIDYKNDSGLIIPVMDFMEDGVFKKCGLYDYIEGAVEFVIGYLELMRQGFSSLKLDRIARYITEYSEAATDPALSAFIGDFPHSEENCDDIYSYAPLLSVEQMNCIYGTRKDAPLRDFYKGSDIQYSFFRSGMDYRKHILNKTTFKKSENDYLTKQRVVIYAAGKYGLEAWYRLNQNEDIDVVAWVDKNYQENEIVQPVSVIKEVEYDFILVCLFDYDVFLKAKRMLESIGVLESKIVWIRDYWKDYHI